MIYRGEFANWNDVQNQFSMSEPEPEDVIIASYDIDSFQGSAFVVYRNGENYYTVSGEHCSCYGLEEQWEPEVYTKELLISSLEKSKYLDNEEKELLQILKA